jgi:peroxiredoxin Q/BCP
MLTIGDKAPLFQTIDQDGNTIQLKDYLGQKVVLFFYPKDNTPGCTTQACNMNDHYETLLAQSVQVLGINPGDQKSHKRFANKYGLAYPLLVDTDHKIADKYGVWGPKAFMGRTFDGIHRTTFLINEKGKIDAILSKVITKAHYDQIKTTWSL